MSGRMTPTLPDALSDAEDVEGADALLVGGLVSLHAAVIVPLPPELEPPLLVEPPPLDDDPQALTVSAAATPHVTNPIAPLRMAHAFPDALGAAHRRLWRMFCAGTYAFDSWITASDAKLLRRRYLHKFDPTTNTASIAKLASELGKRKTPLASQSPSERGPTALFRLCSGDTIRAVSWGYRRAEPHQIAVRVDVTALE